MMRTAIIVDLGIFEKVRLSTRVNRWLLNVGIIKYDAVNYHRLFSFFQNHMANPLIPCSPLLLYKYWSWSGEQCNILF
jgi:hypothetical protein